MDPQQRLLLEVAWEALEDAGQSPGAPGGQPHRRLRRHSHQRLLVDAVRATPTAPRRLRQHRHAHSIVANRLSYVLDLRGPSLAVDTACSSSLVAVHLACQSLRQRRVRSGAGRRREPDPVAALERRRSPSSACCSPTGAARPSTPRADGYRARRGLRRGRAQAARRRRSPTATACWPSSADRRSTRTAAPTASPRRTDSPSRR